MKRSFRHYSLASLVIVVVAAVAIFLAYRTIVIHGIMLIAESSSVTTARIALHPIRQHLAYFLDTANQQGVAPVSAVLPVELEGAIAAVMRDSRVVRVKIYNAQGAVVFSTSHHQIGSQQASNPGFMAAMQGKVSVKLVYRDHFNAFDQSTESDNLVQTYLPVRRAATGPVIGVFETYTDVNPLVMESERSEILIAVVTILVLGAMYGALLGFVARSNRLIAEQQRTIREKSELLEQLSHHNMAREESDRKRWATDLHEGLAQTLGAVKLLLELSRGSTQGEKSEKGDKLQALVPVLQSAISQTRALATDLSPPGLDVLGLGATLRGLSGAFESEHPAVRVDLQFQLAEADVPAPLKIVIYRTVEAVLKLLDSRRAISQVRIRLDRTGSTLSLRIQDEAKVLASAIDQAQGRAGSDPAATEVLERVIISGGTLTVGGEDDAGTLRAAWTLEETPAAQPDSLLQ